MDLVKRYLQAVRWSLFLMPSAQKDDVLQELAANVQAQIEDRQAATGRALEDAELAELLKRHGHPLLVAGRCRQGTRSLVIGKELIGTELFPLYEFVLMVNVVLAVLIALAVSSITGKPTTPATYLYPALFQAGVVTLVFWAINFCAKSLLWTAWDPRKLPRLREDQGGPRPISRLGSLIELVVTPVVIGPWASVPHDDVPPVVGAAQTRPAWSWGPVWQDFHETFYWPVLALLLMNVAVICCNLFRPFWTRPRLLLMSALNCGFAGMLLRVLALHAAPLRWQWLLLTGRAPAAGGAPPDVLAGWTNLGVAMTMLGAAAILLAQGILQSARAFRMSARRAAPGLSPWAPGALFVLAVASRGLYAYDDAHDWPMYNHGVAGHRHNMAEKAINPSTAPRLAEKWRFPARESGQQVGVVHATPIVVNGCVYFGTATDPAFYKLAPNGTLKWVYRNPGRARPPEGPPDQTARTARFVATSNGILASALVTSDTVYFGDLGGWLYALDRASGAERWKLSARGAAFPGAHAFNCFFASPIMAGGKLIAAGGTLEQIVSAFPGYRGNTGRGFVLAVEPETGKIIWKYDLGPKPQRLDPPIVISDSWGKHVFHYGPATSSIWSTPSYDEQTGTLFFGTDVNTAPRRPTAENPRLDTPESCAVVALDAQTGQPKWIRQISPGDIWTNAMRAWDPKTGQYKDQSIGDTPKIYTLPIDGQATRVVGVGSKNGGFYVLRAADGSILAQTPIYTGPPGDPPASQRELGLLALPSPIGGLQTGCATDGQRIFTNGIDAIRLGTLENQAESGVPPTGGRVVAITLDTLFECWRHERPKVPQLGGPPPKPVYHNVGDPVASGIAVANGVLYFTTVASGKLIALESATGAVLKEFSIGPVWSGPSVSRGRVYVGTGNTLFSPADHEAFFPKKPTGEVYSFGLPEEDEVDRMGAGSE